ncbi:MULTISPECIES: hypothetical protein [unclassified Rhodanobacter]|uniref:hypothetical protein n=1 Tax=unclassified Rhodanobacter TaxID=2621553 RepID=UPI001BDFE1BD|nr:MULTISPECIES: hypothetical protein [unclassified Rhodanobacter]MBT2145629.1 hypothetical protein [Rhodanobacter sp. LX-99]MBT2149674.1 hypothetical protein [Rhodanobacter sp. LX-100]
MNMGTDSERSAKALSLISSIFFGVLLSLLFIGTAKVAIHSAPSFDGGMNLEVASSIAKGEGYRRSYAQRDVFPHEIQTGAPYILPAAAVFKIWGIAIPQAQVVNIAYFALLLATTFLLVRQRGSRTLALFAACTAAVVPGILEFGFSGYGEIPAIALVFTATTIFYNERSKRPLAAAFVAGVLLALAVITKTVMLIGAGALCLCVILELAFPANGQRVPHVKRAGALAAGGTLAMIAMELWRAVALGGADAWANWWAEETSGIFRQAGVQSGLTDTTTGLLGKLSLHLHHLSQDYRFAIWATILWLVLLGFAGLATLLRSPKQAGKWSTLTILVIAIVYMAWWLLVTPTAKAWHRRIIDGMICANVGMIMFVATWSSDWRNRAYGRLARMSAILITCLILSLPLVWLVKGSRALVYASTNLDDNRALLHVVQEVRALPKNAYIFGVGWYSAPTVSLLAERLILDFNDIPVSRLETGRPVYFVQEPGDSTDYLGRVRSTYQLPEASPGSYALLAATSLTPSQLVPQHDKVRRYINASDNYSYMHGFNESEGSNGRWLSDDNLVLLTPTVGDHFELVVYTLPQASYLYDSAPKIIVSFNGCAAPAQDSIPGNMSKLIFPIPDNCSITPSQPVNVRIEVDNLIDAAITRDPRSLSVVGKELGFVGPQP